MGKLFILTLLFACSLVLVGLASSQVTPSQYLVRLEHQTREENVCMLVQKDGHYHLERTAMGHPRVFEGTLESPALAELEAHLNAQQIVDLKQSQIDAAAGEDMDQVMITIRAAGWQKLIFPRAARAVNRSSRTWIRF